MELFDGRNVFLIEQRYPHKCQTLMGSEVGKIWVFSDILPLSGGIEESVS